MFCKKVRSKIKALFAQFTDYMEQHAELSIKVTSALKTALESPVAHILTAIIPGDVDETIRVRLLQGLSLALEGLDIVKECQAEDLEDKLQCFIKEIKERNPELQAALFHKIASILVRTLDDNQKAAHIYDLFIQAKYSAEK